MLKRVIVSGYGEAAAKPDIAVIGISIAFVQPEAKAAQELVANITEKVLTGLKSLGVPDKDIETKGYSINPHYEWKKNSRVFKGYEAHNALRIRTDKLFLVNQIIDAAVKAGVKEIDYVKFEHKDRASLGYEALKKATQNAVERATAIAEGLGAQIGKVIRVSDKRRSYNGGYYISERSAEYAPPKSVVAPHEVKTTAEVEAVFELI